MLPARTRGAVDIDLEIAFVDLDVDLFGRFGEDRDSRGADV